mgnify:CR=1 FL=1
MYSVTGENHVVLLWYEHPSEALMVDHVLLELEGYDFECRLKSGKGSTLLIQCLIDEGLDRVEHWNQFLQAFSCLS